MNCITKLFNSISKKRAIALATALVLVSSAISAAIIAGRAPLKVYAKETFTDMGRIVESHSGDSAAFNIVDIVPGSAVLQKDGYPDISVSLGTLGYLIDGQDSITSDIYNAFTKEADRKFFMRYNKRYEIASTLVHDNNINISNGSGNQDFQIKYEEAYEGTGIDITKDGWKKLYSYNETYNRDFFDAYNSAEHNGADKLAFYEESTNEGYLYGTAVEKQAGDSSEGFDYVKITGGTHSDDEGALIDVPSDKSFVFDNANGAYFVNFYYKGAVSSGDKVSGYKVKDVVYTLSQGSDFSTIPSTYSKNTGLYFQDSEGVYSYVGKIKNFSGTATEGNYYILTFEYDAEIDGDINPGTQYYGPGQYATVGSVPAYDRYNMESTMPLGTGIDGLDGGSDGSLDESTTPTGAATSSATPTPTETPTGFADPSATPTDTAMPTVTPTDAPTVAPTDTPEPVPTDTPEPTVTPTATPDAQARANYKNIDSKVNAVKISNSNIEYAAPVNNLAVNVLNNSMFALACIPVSDVESFRTSGSGDAYVYVGPGNGDWKITETDNSADGIIEVLNAPTYIRCVIGNDLLRRYVFASLDGLENNKSDFKINITTILASDSDKLSTALETANLVYLEKGYAQLTKGYDRAEEHNYDLAYDYISANLEEGDNPLYSPRDMSATNATTIIKKLIDGEIAVMADHEISKDVWYYPDTIYQQLVKILEKKDIEGYYLAMTKDEALLDKQYQNLFDDHNINPKKYNSGAEDKYPANDINGYNYVSNHLYIMNDQSILHGDYVFNQSFSEGYAKDGFSEVLNAIDINNERLSEDDRIGKFVSKARAIQYILIDVAGQYHDINILELQPTKNKNNDLVYDTAKKAITWNRNNEETAITGRKAEQLLKSDKDITVNIKNVSVDEFNSSLANINSEYSMIFIGIDGSRLNVETTSDKKNKFYKYNDEAIYKKAYNLGDAGYDAIDLTTAKSETLINFLKAGYPIVFEDDCFVNGSTKNDVNTLYIQSDTKMYNFINKAKSEFPDYIYTIKDLATRSTLSGQLNTQRPYIEYNQDLGGAAVYELKENEATKKLEAIIQYQVKSGITTTNKDEQGNVNITRGDYSGGYNMSLYFDLNCDGVFADTEQLADTMYTIVGNTITIDVSKIPNGIIPWAVKVADASNEYRNCALTGFMNITNSVRSKVAPINNIIRVLQIVGAHEEASSDNKYDLEAMFKDYQDKSENAATAGNYESTLLGYMLGGAQETIGAKYEFTTLTIAEANSLLSGTKVDNLDLEYLDMNQYDVLVLGFGEGSSLAGGGAILEATQKYIDEGRPTVVSSLNSSFENSLGVTPASTGLMTSADDVNYQTYVDRAQRGSGLYRFAKLNSSSLGYTGKLIADQINDGIVSHFPYIISESLTVDSSIENSIKAGTYLLDYRNNLSGTNVTVGDVSGGDLSKGNVTAWLALNNSPGTATSSEGNYVTAFEASPRDGRNNYYIYSKDNVFYIGQNNYPYKYTGKATDFSTANGVNECMLFVNTLMGAYNVGIKSPKVAIVAGYGIESPEIESITVPFDAELKSTDAATNGVLDGEIVNGQSVVDVYFKASDTNLVLKQEDLVTFYYQDPSGTISLKGDLDITPRNGQDVNLTSFASPVWKVENSKEVPVTTTNAAGYMILEANTVYRIKAPITSLRNNDGLTMADIYVVVESDSTKFGKTTKSRGYDKVSLNRAQMFMLD